jgi:hypothetical protein
MEIESKNHQDVAEPDQIASGMAGTGQEKNELAWMKKHAAGSPTVAERTTGTDNDMPCNPAIVRSSPKLVERKTALRGQAIDPPPRPKRPARSRTEKDLLAYDSDIPYAAVEKANRDLVCSLIERQDRVSEGLLLLINDLQYRVDDIELALGPKLTQGRGKVPE